MDEDAEVQMQGAVKNLFHSPCPCTRRREQHRQCYGAFAVPGEIGNPGPLVTGFRWAL